MPGRIIMLTIEDRSSQLAEEWFRSALEPEPILTVSEWSDQHRVLSRKAASEPGRWRTSRTPYLKRIMDVLSVTHPAKEVVFMKSAQIGGTECGNNWIGYVIDHAPGPMMVVYPRIEDARRNSKLRVEPLIEETPRLRDRVGAAKRSKDASNTILQKSFEGGELVMTGANSGAGLRSMPARYRFLDEIDAYPHDVDGEGDPIALVAARSRTFSRRKGFLVSTPTIAGQSKIEAEYEASSKEKYHVPCPGCGEFQSLKFKQLQWENDDPETVLYYCEHCGMGIEEHEKTKMLAKGKWIAENPHIKRVGFHINSLYSPVGWFSWKEIVFDFLEAKGDREKMKTFVNTVLGETWKDKGDAPEWRRLYLRREEYAVGKVPNGPIFLTAGVDVQKDRIELEVVGWGRRKENWSIDYIVIPGDTSKEEPWNELSEIITGTFETVDGRELPLRLTAIDSGYNTQVVYNFCRKFNSRYVIPVKGSDNMNMAAGIPKIVDVKMSALGGKNFRRGVQVWTIGVSHLKSELYGWLKQDEPIGEEVTPVGWSHFPQYGEEYFKQLTAEKAVTKHNSRNYKVTEWVKERERNEALDCRIYNRAAASIVGIDRFKDSDWDKLSRNTGIAKSIKKDDNKIVTRQNRKKKKPKSDFW